LRSPRFLKPVTAETRGTPILASTGRTKRSHSSIETNLAVRSSSSRTSAS
jgi:hypothetical protein